MRDLISRQAAIEALVDKGQASRRYRLGEIWELNYQEIREALNAVPSAQPKPKTGHWIILDSDSERYEDIKCPFCGHTFTVDAWRWCDIGFIKEDFNFCPNCGADMRGDTT